MATSTPLLNGSSNDDTQSRMSLMRNTISNSVDKLQRNRDQLVAVLGGMDGILLHYIDADVLTEQQLESIHSILLSPPVVYSVSQPLPTYGTIVLDETNTFLHHIFSVQSAECLIKWIYHRFTIVIAFIYCVLHVIIGAYIWIGNHHSLSNGFLFALFLFDFISSTYFILLILSGNRKAFRFCMKSFEFWIKILYAFRMMIASTTYVILKNQTSVWGVLDRLFGRYLLIMVATVLYSSMDGLRLRPRIKTAFGGTLASFVTIYAVYETLLAEPYHVQIGSFTIDLLDIMARSNRVLSVFLWKQAILSTWKQGKAQMISTWVNIEWVTNQKKETTCTMIQLQE